MLTHTRPTLWLPTMEVQETPWIGTLPQHEHGTDVPSDYNHEDMDNTRMWNRKTTPP